MRHVGRHTGRAGERHHPVALVLHDKPGGHVHGVLPEHHLGVVDAHAEAAHGFTTRRAVVTATSALAKAFEWRPMRVFGTWRAGNCDGTTAPSAMASRSSAVATGGAGARRAARI